MALVHLTVHLYLQTRFEKLSYPTDPPFHSNSSGRSWFFGVLTAYSSYIICSPFLTSHTCNNLNKGIDKPLMICSTTLNPTSTSLVQFSPELHWICMSQVISKGLLPLFSICSKLRPPVVITWASHILCSLANPLPGTRAHVWTFFSLRLSGKCRHFNMQTLTPKL